MLDDQSVQMLDTQLFSRMPGGKYIAPHLQDGPFWLVPVASREDPNWQIRVLAQAYPPVTRVLVEDYGVCELFAVPQFVFEMLQWHNCEYEMSLAEGEVGPLETEPTPADVVNHLIAWADPDDKDPQTATRVREALTQVPPQEVLARLSMLDMNLEAIDELLPLLLNALTGTPDQGA